MLHLQQLHGPLHVGQAPATELEVRRRVGPARQPLGVAGGFTIDGRGGPFVESVEGDPHAVQGLSVHGLRELLGRLGVGIQRLWRAPEQTA